MDVVQLLSQYGAIGIFAGLFYILFRQASQRDQARSDSALEREKERADRAEQRFLELTNYYRDTVIPALERSASATLDVIRLLTEQEERRKVEVAEREAQRRIEEALMERDKRERERNPGVRRSPNDF